MHCMKSSGFSVTFVLAWIITLLVLALVVAVLKAAASQPAIVLAAQVLIVVSLAMLILVPMILLSMLRNTQRSADYLRELVNRAVDDPNDNQAAPRTVIK